MIDKITTYDEYLASDEMAKSAMSLRLLKKTLRIIKTTFESLPQDYTNANFPNTFLKRLLLSNQLTGGAFRRYCCLLF